MGDYCRDEAIDGNVGYSRMSWREVANLPSERQREIYVQKKAGDLWDIANDIYRKLCYNYSPHLPPACAKNEAVEHIEAIGMYIRDHFSQFLQELSTLPFSQDRTWKRGIQRQKLDALFAFFRLSPLQKEVEPQANTHAKKIHMVANGTNVEWRYASWNPLYDGGTCHESHYSTNDKKGAESQCRQENGAIFISEIN